MLEIIYAWRDVDFPYTGYDGQMNEWGDGVEMPPVSYANFSFMFV